MAWQLVPVGLNLTCANPLAALAVIDPDWLVVRSLMVVCRPLGVSCIVTCRWSPEFMNRSFDGSGVNVVSVDWTGLAGAWETPFLVRNAKLTYSRPALAWHVGFWNCP